MRLIFKKKLNFHDARTLPHHYCNLWRKKLTLSYIFSYSQSKTLIFKVLPKFSIHESTLKMKNFLYFCQPKTEFLRGGAKIIGHWKHLKLFWCCINTHWAVCSVKSRIKFGYFVQKGIVLLIYFNKHRQIIMKILR